MKMSNLYNQILLEDMNNTPNHLIVLVLPPRK